MDDERPKRPLRRHGLQCPMHPRQVIVLVLLWSSVFIFFGLVAPFLPQPQRLIYHVVNGALVFVLFLTWLSVSLADPSTSIRHANQSDQGPGVPMSPLCPDCNVQMGPGVKHCKLCVKCVAGFDHHCLYLNTCIAKDNYKSFFLTLWLAIALCVCHLVAALTGLQAEKGSYTWDIAEYTFGAFQNWAIILGVALIVTCTALLPTAILALFHVYLLLTGSTTYAWLIARREAEAEKERKKVEASPEFAAAQKKREAEQERIRKQFLENKEKEKRVRELQMVVADQP